MMKLLRCEFYKLIREKSLYICLLIVMLLIGLPIMVYAMDPSGDVSDLTDYLFLSAFTEGGVDMALPILVALLVCRDFNSGAMKLIVGRGYQRSHIYCAKFFATVGATIIFALVSWAVAVVTIGLFFHCMVEITWEMVGILAAQVLAMVLIESISFFIAMVSRKSAVAISVGLMLPLVGTILVTVIDTIYEMEKIRLMDYWPWTFLAELSDHGVEHTAILRCSCISLIGISIIFLLGLFHFKKSDV